MNHAAQVLYQEALTPLQSLRERVIWLICVPQDVIKLMSDIRVAFGESDEYSFILHKNTTLYGQHAAHFMPKYVTSQKCYMPQQQCFRTPQLQAYLGHCLCIHCKLCPILGNLLPKPTPLGLAHF